MTTLMLFAALASGFAVAVRPFPVGDQPLRRCAFFADVLSIAPHFLLRVVPNGPPVVAITAMLVLAGVHAFRPLPVDGLWPR